MEISKCECGCDQNVSEGKNGWNRFIHGHHAKGRKKSEEEKRKIGEKNSINMKRYYEANPDEARKKINKMNLTHDAEFHIRRIEATKKAYELMSTEDKQKFSDHAKKLWEDGSLREARGKAAQTFKQRSKEGKYDFESRNDKISESIANRYRSGGFEWSKGKYVSAKTGVVCHYRSSWEKLMMEELDSNPNVKTWEYEFASIKYELDEKSRRYIPDFHAVLFDSTHVLIEVKPESLRKSKMNKAKRQSAVKYCAQRGWIYQEWEPSHGSCFKLPT